MFFPNKSPQEIAGRLAALATELEQAAGAIRTAEEAAAQAYIEGTEADFGAVAVLTSRQAAMRSAISRLQVEQAAAERRERLAEAAAKRTEAQRLRTEAAKLIDAARPLLAKLSALMGVQFDHRALGCQPVGPWVQDMTHPGLPDEYRLIHELGQPDRAVGGGFATPRHRQLWDEAITLDERAVVIEESNGRAAA
jgi:hypothetical protein